MTCTGLLVVRAGLHTTVQDEGRWGHQHLGVPVGGALDLDALRRANALVGNAPDEAALEVTLVGCTLRAEVPCTSPSRARRSTWTWTAGRWRSTPPSRWLPATS